MPNSPLVFEVDVYPVPSGTDASALRWAAAYYGCPDWRTTVRVGNTRGAQCDTAAGHGQRISYLMVRKHQLIVVFPGDGKGYGSAEFRDHFRLA